MPRCLARRCARRARTARSAHSRGHCARKCASGGRLALRLDPSPPVLPRTVQAQELAREALDDRLCLFIGAGVSFGAGLPGWNSLLAALEVLLCRPSICSPENGAYLTPGRRRGLGFPRLSATR